MIRKGILRDIAVPKVEAAHVILRLSGKYVMQLRDDKPDIAAHGQWSIFGGEINSGEAPLEAIKRELFEELSIQPDELRFLWQTDYYYDFIKGIVRTWFFISNVDRVWDAHKLKEGKAVGVFSFNELVYLDIPEVMKQTLNRYHNGKQNISN